MNELRTKINNLNIAYWNERVKLLKAKAPKEDLEKLANNRRKLELALRKLYGDTLTKLNLGMEIKIS
jgi:hypothetical protein